MSHPSFPTRIRPPYWTLWLVNPAFKHAAELIGDLPYNDPVAISVSHAAMLMIERDTIAVSGGFND